MFDKPVGSVWLNAGAGRLRSKIFTFDDLLKEIVAAGADRDARAFFIDQQIELRIFLVGGALEIFEIRFPIAHVRKRIFLFCVRYLKCLKAITHFILRFQSFRKRKVIYRAGVLSELVHNCSLTAGVERGEFKLMPINNFVIPSQNNYGRNMCRGVINIRGETLYKKNENLLLSAFSALFTG